MSSITFTQAEIKAKLQSSQQWVERAILAIYSNQTQSERMAGITHDLNGIGFNGFDAEILSSFATRLIMGKHLTPKQLKIAFHKMPKYAGQLYRMIYTTTEGETVAAETVIDDHELADRKPVDVVKEKTEMLVGAIEAELTRREARKLEEPERATTEPDFIVGAVGNEVQLCEGCELITAREYVSREVAEIKAGIVQSLIDSGAGIEELLEALD